MERKKRGRPPMRRDGAQTVYFRLPPALVAEMDVWIDAGRARGETRSTWLAARLEEWVATHDQPDVDATSTGGNT